MASSRHRSGRAATLRLIPLLAFAAFLVWSGGAVAAQPGSDDDSLVDQYRERIKTGGGSQTTGGGGGTGSAVTPLPGPVQEALYQEIGSKDERAAERLEEIATSRRFGAPEEMNQGSASLGTGGEASSALPLPTGEGGARALGLLAALALLSAVLLAAMVRQRRT